MQYGILPVAGGWDAQDELWKQDYYTWSALQARAAFERHERDTTKDPLADLFGKNADNKLPDWEELIKG